MMKKLIALTLVAGMATASANLLITEVMSNSDNPGGPGNGDWFELYNSGGSSVNLSGYYWDDDANGTDQPSIFPNVSIAGGGTLLVVDENSGNIGAWEDTVWDIDEVASATVVSEDDFTGDDSFSGLSAGGDAIYVWDGDPTGSGNLVASVTFGDSDGGGKSFEWDSNGTSRGVPVDCENGAFRCPNDGDGGTPGEDVGSPGYVLVIPEPTALSLLTLAGAALLRRRR
jgi:hypothetical protein